MSDLYLLDANVLIALSFTDHVHHKLATAWFSQTNPTFATCPITQGALVRFAIRHLEGKAALAKDLLAGIAGMEQHRFWEDSVDFSHLPWTQVFGYRQVTDAYLVTLARHREGRLVTLDQALNAVFPDTVLIAPDAVPA